MSTFPDIHQSMKETLFKQYIKPLLRENYNLEHYMYFLDQASRMWVMDISRGDIGRFHVLQKGYAELYTKDAELFVDTCKQILSRLHDSRIIVEGSMADFYDVDDSDIIKKYKKGFEYYKSLYESEFGLGISLFTAYVYKLHNHKLEKKKDIEYITAPTNTKLKALNDADFQAIGDEIDAILRNGGAGHEKWEVLDNGECLIDDVNPCTGKISSKYTLTLDILEEKIKQMERLTLIIDLSIHVFLTNNPHISEGVGNMSQFKTILKINEIGRYAGVMAEEFQLSMRKYSFDRNILKFEIFNEKPMIGIGKSTMYTDRFACDVVHQKVSVRYLDQIISILIDVIGMNGGECFSSDIRITDKEGELLFEFKWGKEDMIRWYKEIDANHKKKIYPPHLTQDAVEKSYSLIIDHKIEYGKGDYVDSILRNPLFTLKYQSFILAYHSFEES